MNRSPIFRTLLICLILVLGLTVAQAQTGNLLTNPGFESPFEAVPGSTTSKIAQGWTAWSVTTGQNQAPEYYPASDTTNGMPTPRIHGGTDAQQYFTFFAPHVGGVYQKVTGLTPGEPLTFSIYAYLWVSSGSDPNASDGSGDLALQIGIDPNGGTDPGSTSVVWSNPLSVVDQYAQHTVTASAVGDSVTVFVRSTVNKVAMNNVVYLDDASLTVGAAPAATSGVATEAATSAVTAEATQVATEAATQAAVTLPAQITPEVTAVVSVEATSAVTPEVIEVETTEIVPVTTAEVTEVTVPEVTEAATEAPTPIPFVTEAVTPEVTEAVTEAPTQAPTETTAPTQTQAPTNTSAPTDTSSPTLVPPTDTPTPVPTTAEPTATFTPGTPTSTFTPAPPTATFTPAPPTSTPLPSPTLDMTQYPYLLEYTVVPGDTVGALATRFGSSVAAIIIVNQLGSDARIYRTQKLIIPVQTLPQPTAIPSSTPLPTQPVPATPTEAPVIVQPAQPPQAPTQQVTIVTTYTVRFGDTLSSIASRFGITTLDLAHANNIVNPNLIYLGQVLHIPGAGSPVPVPSATPTSTVLPPTPAPQLHLYMVLPGDNLYRISVRFNVSLVALIEANGIDDGNRIFVGQILIIP